MFSFTKSSPSQSLSGRLFLLLISILFPFPFCFLFDLIDPSSVPRTVLPLPSIFSKIWTVYEAFSHTPPWKWLYNTRQMQYLFGFLKHILSSGLSHQHIEENTYYRWFYKYHMNGNQDKQCQMVWHNQNLRYSTDKTVLSRKNIFHLTSFRFTFINTEAAVQRCS